VLYRPSVGPLIEALRTDAQSSFKNRRTLICGLRPPLEQWRSYTNPYTQHTFPDSTDVPRALLSE